MTDSSENMICFEYCRYLTVSFIIDKQR